MNRLVKVGFVLAAMLAAFSAYSSDLFRFTKGNTQNPTQLKFEHVDSGTVICIKDSNDFLLYREVVQSTGAYSKRFDMSKLPDASYYVELENKTGIEILPFVVQNNKVEFSENEMVKFSKPQLELKNGRVYLSNLPEGDKALKVCVFYEGQDKAFSETIETPKNNMRVYDFNGSLSGEYLITVNAHDRVFELNIEL